jgi:uncharacterized protein YndB with AHSA1/START domain
MTLNIRAPALAAALFLGFGPIAAAETVQRVVVSDCSQAGADGTRTLCQEAVVPATPDLVWSLFSSGEGLSSWVAPMATIDLRVGGVWETSYRTGARSGDENNIRNRVLSYLPGRMLSVQVDHAPPGFPQPELVHNVWTVIELDAVGAGQTRVRVSMPGYGAGAGYDGLYAFFERGNAFTLQKLFERVVSGPVDWSATRIPGQAATGIQR